jgi:hypothetical protein
MGRSLRGRLRAALAALPLAFVAVAASGAVSEENFLLRKGSDLVELCSVAAEDPLQVAAIHMCHGFGVGVYQTLVAVSAHEKVDDFLCPPNPPPSRNQAFADFLVWAKKPENAGHLSESPAALVGHFLVTTAPCPKATAATGGAR